MRTVKRTFQNFKYRECDAFAEYLHEQSLRGWHFKEWRLGLVFEKGEPKDIYYAVEIFPKGTEMTTGAEEDTKEYAEYCVAAGWKFLDANRRFCIFRKEQESAVPIVEPGERFANIRKAEWRAWFNMAIGPIILMVMNILNFWQWNFARYIFYDLMLYVVAVIAVIGLYRAGEGIYLLWWERRAKHLLAAGKVVCYGRRRTAAFRWQTVVGIIAYLGFVYLARTQLVSIILPTTIVGLMVMAVCVIVAIWRPSIFDNWTFQTIAAVLICVAAFSFLMIGFVSGDEQTVGSGVRQADTAPLTPADYLESGGGSDNEQEVFGEYMEGILGYSYHFEIDSVRQDRESSLRYEVYHSPHRWIVDRIWKLEMKNRPDGTDCRALWGAEEAVRYGLEDGDAFAYEVRYPNAVVFFWIDGAEILKEEEIAVIREKLSLP